MSFVTRRERKKSRKLHKEAFRAYCIRTVLMSQHLIDIFRPACHTSDAGLQVLSLDAMNGMKQEVGSGREICGWTKTDARD
jgi:hypothetical protein